MAAAACSDSDSSSPNAVTTEGGEASSEPPEAGLDVQVTNPNEAKQIGRVVDALGKSGLTGAVISIAGKTATTDESGKYAIIVPKNTPYSMSVTEDNYWKLNEQEWIVKKDLFDRTDTSILSDAIASILSGLLPAQDPTKGILVVRIYPMPPCDSEEGSKISIAPMGTAKVTYFVNGQPDKTATSTKKDQSFSAAVTDVEPGQNVTVTVDSPSCEQLPFPVDFQGVTYTGVQKTEAGHVLSYLRVFIGPKKITDAGTD